MAHRTIVLIGAVLLASAALAHAQGDSPAAAPNPSRLETLRLLRARKFDQLDELVHSAQAAAERDVRHEAGLVRILHAFDTSDPTITPLVDAWVAHAAASYPARIARAQHHTALAWAARGSKWGKDTSAAQFEQMRVHFARVAGDAEFALVINPRLSVAYARLIGAARSKADVEACGEIFERAYAQTPASLEVRWAFALCLLPRWGGSYKLLEALAEDSAGFEGRNPALAAFGGVVAWDRGRSFDEPRSPDAAALYSEAIAKGAHPAFLISRARAYLWKRRYDDTLADLNRALAIEPDVPEALMLRAWALNDMGRNTAAAEDIRLVQEIDPANDLLAEFRTRENASAVTAGRQSYDERNWAAAIARLSTAAELTGGNPEVFYWRGRARVRSGDDAGGIVDLQHAIQIDPRYFDAYWNLTFVVSRNKDYGPAVELWTRYLTLEPANGHALLARARAYVGQGQAEKAAADAATACKLGVNEACAWPTGATPR